MPGRVSVVVLMSLLMSAPVVSRAEELAAAPTPLRRSVARQLAQSSSVSSAGALTEKAQPQWQHPQEQQQQAQQQAQSGKKSFIKRRPVISGMLIGMAAGSAVAAAAWHSEAAFIGFYSGAAGGALIGWALSR